MDFELRAATEKLEKEQRERKERARKRLEREKKAKAEAAIQRDAIESAQRIRRLEEARARQLAERKLEESLLTGNGVVFVQTFEAVHYDGYGDKIKLPPSCFTELSNQGALDKGPMYFRLSKVDASPASERKGYENKSHDSTHSGVLEFTASEGYVDLPSHIWNNLFPNNDIAVPLIEVRYVTLPKGTYAQLQPIGLGFLDIPNHKAVLETSLRVHSTLSQGDIITVKHGEHNYKIRVLELKPSSSVSVIDTDVDVDIMEADSTSDSTDQHALIPLLLGKVEEGMVKEGKFQYYKFSVDDAVSRRVASGDFNLEVKVETGTGEGDTDVYLSRHPVIFPTEHQYGWSSHVVGSNILVFGSKDNAIIPGTYSIGVFGFKGSSKFHITVAIKENTGRKLGEQTDSSSQMDLDTVECQNCKRYISSRSVMIHEAYCIRHNIVCQHDGCGVVLKKDEASNHVHCDKCGEGLQKQEMEKHMKVFHEPVYCSCGVLLEKKEMVDHQSVCPLRLITCRFCGDMVQAGAHPRDTRDRLRGLSEHESICGSRTAPCHSCGRSVMLKEMDIHITAVHPQN